ncbi:hypothetical protein PVA17_25165, partial [Lysinibacillus sp. CNPSo 3705]
ADHRASQIAKNIGNNEDLFLASFQASVGFWRGRAVRAFGKDAAAQVTGNSTVDDALHRSWDKHVAWY